MNIVHRPAADADPYLHYLAGLVHGLELRVDGIEAVVGELRQRIDQLERVVRLHHYALFPWSESLTQSEFARLEAQFKGRSS